MRYTQPQAGPVQIDWGNPISRGLTVAFNGANPSLNFATRTPITATSPAPRTTVRDGVAPLLSSAGGTGFSLGADPRFNPDELTLFVVATIATVPSTGYSVFARDDATLGRAFTFDIYSPVGLGLRFYVNGGGSSGSNELRENITPVAGRRYVAAATYSGSRAALFVDGAQVALSTIFPAKGAATGETQIGRRSYSGFTDNLDGTIPVAFMWQRVLTDAEVKSVSANPWQLFKSSTLLLPSAAVQLLRPSSDISAGSWTPSSGVNLFATLNESVASDATYDLTSQASTFEVGMTAGTSPGVTTGHVVRYRILGAVTVSLRQGTTTIASWSQAPSVMTSFAQTLTGVQAAAITNYAALSLQFQAT